MNRPHLRAVAAALAAGLLALFAVACGSGADSTAAVAGAKTLRFELTDAGCSPRNATAPAGPIDFEVSGGSSSVTELEILEGETIVGEKEDLTEGLSASFSLNLERGRYTVRCSGAEHEDGILTVTGGQAAAGGVPASQSPGS